MSRDEGVAQATGESAETPLPVDAIAGALKDIVSGAFPPLWVEGEITKFTAHRSGHWYFVLKGKTASMQCVVWASTARWLPAKPDEGMQVVVLGQLDVWEGRTEVRFAITKLMAAGDGLWRKAFEQTRAKLEADGLLDPARKRPLPFYPRRVAVITSRDGAAFHDIVAVIQRRNPFVEIVLIPAAVQGEDAARSLAAALNRLSSWGEADVAIIGRGGGSREDLWVFNDERVARRVAACPIPIVSAVGHEVDTTICDLVADFRAATPSAAAELVVPMHAELVQLTTRLQRRLGEALRNRTRIAQQRLAHSARRLTLSAERGISERRLSLAGLAGRLEALSPLATLKRGFSVVSRSDGHVVTSVQQVTPGDVVRVRTADGAFGATVQVTEPTNPSQA